MSHTCHSPLVPPSDGLKTQSPVGRAEEELASTEAAVERGEWEVVGCILRGSVPLIPYVV